jgi:hypothetical protein
MGAGTPLSLAQRQRAAGGFSLLIFFFGEVRSVCLEMLRFWALFSSRDAFKSLRSSGEDPPKEIF